MRVLICIVIVAILLPWAHGQQPGPPVPPTNPPEDYRFNITIPEGCNRSDCNYFLAIQTNNNSDYLDFYLEGVAQGWIAVGFSNTQNMLSADVMGCNRDTGTAMVNAVDTWNRDNVRFNELDANQTGIERYAGTFEDGRIWCSFSRRIQVVNEGQDLNLDGDYFLLLGRGETPGNTGSFPVHERTPMITGGRMNPVRDEAVGPEENTPTPEQQPVPPTNPPEDYRFIITIPERCNRSDCNYFLAIQTNENSDYLDFYLEGVAQGWIAVGFSNTQNMLSADVMGCNRDAGIAMVNAVDTWNPGNDRTNVLDANQTGIERYAGTFEDGRIWCSFSRRIQVVNEGQDLNLDGDYFLLLGRGETSGGTGSFPVHEVTPRLTGDRVNPVRDETVGPEENTPTPEQQPVPPTNPPEDYRFIITIPERCNRSDCNYFLAIQTNENSAYLDFYLEGVAQGWIAVGFSNTQNMLSADVMGCNRNTGTAMVNAVDTWNPDTIRTNVLDANQIGVQRYAGTFENGRISCSFSRLIRVVNEGQDLNLDEDYFLLLGRGEAPGGTGSFPVHEVTPMLTGDRVNPVRDETVGPIESAPLNPLVQAHGIFMTIAWPILAVTGIFFAAWMRPALPNGEWFQVHRALLLGSLFFGAVGFILIFVAFRDTNGRISLGSDNPVGTAHFVIGIVVMALQIVNPIIAAFRCKPKGKNRWIFNLSHGTLIGLGAELLALTNIGLGLSIFSRMTRFGDLTIFWVYLAFIIFFVVMVGVLLIVFSILTCQAEEEKRVGLAPSLLKPMLSTPPSKPKEMELNAKGDPAPANSDDPPPRKPPSEDAPLRWIALGVFLAVMLPLMLTIIVLVALPV